MLKTTLTGDRGSHLWSFSAILKHQNVSIMNVFRCLHGTMCCTFQEKLQSVASRASCRFQEKLQSVASRTCCTFQEKLQSVAWRASRETTKTRQPKNAGDMTLLAPPPTHPTPSPPKKTTKTEPTTHMNLGLTPPPLPNMLAKML